MRDKDPDPCGCSPGAAGAERTIPLSEMTRGQTGTVKAAQLPTHERALLRAMGLRVNAKIEVCRLGEPCIVRVMGGTRKTADGSCSCRIALARPLADHVLVGLHEPAPRAGDGLSK